MFIIFDSTPESIKNHFQGLFGFSKRSGIVQIFSFGICTLFAVFWYIFFVLELLVRYSLLSFVFFRIFQNY